MSSGPATEAGVSKSQGISEQGVWRARPMLVRRAVPAEYCARFDYTKVEAFVSSLPHMRVFVSETHLSTDSVPAARLVPRDNATKIFQQLLKSCLKYTILFNQVETVDDDVRQIRDHMRIPHRWREDDIVVTFSTLHSGIGYHAGHEDAIIVQASGRRRWRVWPAEAVDDAERKRILISAHGDYYALSKSKHRPLIECELTPGDVLYIPPFCPHEGKTIEESISIALGWRGIAYFHFLLAFPDLVSVPDRLHLESLPSPFFDLIPDHGSAYINTTSLSDLVVERLEQLGCTIFNSDLLALRLRTLFLNSNSGVT